MFTGLIEEIGIIENINPVGGNIRLRIHAQKTCGSLHMNDSVSMNGVCLTVIWNNTSSFEVESVEETLKKTSIGSLNISDRVNLELPLQLNDRLGGHLVQGHVDATETVTGIEKRDNSWLFTFSLSKQFSKYIVLHGSIAIDGVSLTVAQLTESNFGVSIIPTTMQETTFHFYKIGTIVNIEVDILAKYVERLTGKENSLQEKKKFLTEHYLRDLGY